MGASRYWELAVAVSPDLSEGVTNFVWELGALGVMEEEIDGAPPRLRAFFPASAVPAAVEARVRDYLDSLRMLGFARAGAPTVTAVADERWADAWRRHFRPTPVGRRLLIAPPWEAPSPDGRVVLVIEPGRAFGTGHHGSTAGCLAQLESVIAREHPSRGLDLGTGSGILAIAAARLGGVAMLAVDDDPDAVVAAAANAARNDVSDRVRCLLADARALAVAPVDLVVANILAAAHRALAPRYRDLVAPGGTLLLGGLLDTEASALTEVMAAHGFRRRDRVSVEGWTTLELARGPA